LIDASAAGAAFAVTVMALKIIATNKLRAKEVKVWWFITIS
jgi:hypothetical protein